jgi:hypothetical protein
MFDRRMKATIYRDMRFHLHRKELGRLLRHKSGSLEAAANLLKWPPIDHWLSRRLMAALPPEETGRPAASAGAFDSEL